MLKDSPKKYQEILKSYVKKSTFGELRINISDILDQENTYDNGCLKYILTRFAFKMTDLCEELGCNYHLRQE